MVRIIVGDALEALRGLPDGSVHCCVTSPPYWGLRSYLGDPGMIGLEPTFEAHLANLVAVFREVRRVLRDDGCAFVNYGDAYWPGGPNNFGWKAKDLMDMPGLVSGALMRDGWWRRSAMVWQKPNAMPESVRDRPTSSYEMVYLLGKSGAATYWTNPNYHGVRTQPEPDYVYDVKTRKRRNLWVGHSYFYDADAVRVAFTPYRENKDGTKYNPMTSGLEGRPRNTVVDSKPRVKNPAGANLRNVLEVPETPVKQRGHDRVHEGFRDRWDGMTKAEQQAGGASMRNVMKVATHAFREAHFATFPPKLIEPFIKAGTSEKGCCADCGAGWVRVVETEFVELAKRKPTRKALQNADMADVNSRGKMGYNATETLGWRPSCECEADTVPATVLDCFAGAGTTGLVADRLGRDAILIEISPEYAEMAAKRIRGDNPMFTSVEVT